MSEQVKKSIRAKRMSQSMNKSLCECTTSPLSSEFRGQSENQVMMSMGCLRFY